MKNLRGTIALALVLGAVPCFAASNIFLKIPGIKGDATDAAHNGWIEISSFSWGMSNATSVATHTNTQGCASNEIRFGVRGAVIVPLEKMLVLGHPQSVTLDVNGQRHALDGAMLTSCRNNFNTAGDAAHTATCVLQYQRCATHAVASRAVNTSMLNRSAIQPNASFSLGADPAQDVSIIAVRPMGSTDVVVTERGASPVFFKNCVAGAHYKKVTLNMRKAGGTQAEYLNFTLRDVIVTSVKQNADGSVSLALKYGMADGSVRGYQDLH